MLWLGGIQGKRSFYANYNAIRFYHLNYEYIRYITSYIYIYVHVIGALWNVHVYLILSDLIDTLNYDIAGYYNFILYGLF